jgi:hypothetical protein
LTRALDTLVGADDFGSTAAEATSLGNLTSSILVSGTIGKVSDSDFFRFTASSSGQVTFTIDTTGNLDAKWQAPTGATVNGNTVTMNVVAGQSYVVGVGTDSGIGKFSIEGIFTASNPETPPTTPNQPQNPNPNPNPPTTPKPPTTPQLPALSGNWGTIASNQVNNLQLQTGSNYYQLVAGRTGTLTVEASFSPTAGNIDLEVYDSQNRLVGSSSTGGASERIDLSVSAGEIYYVRAKGTNREVDFRLTNLVTINGNQVDVGGTSARDVYNWSHGGSQQQLTVNGVTYALVATSQVHVQAGGGNDSITVRGSNSIDTITTTPGTLNLISSVYRISATGVEQVNVRGDSYDSIIMYDSAGRDVLEANAAWVGLAGVGHQTLVEGIRNITVVSQGGNDISRLLGTSGADHFTVDQGIRTLTNNSVALRVENFATVGFFGRGGNDIVEITGMTSEDQLYGRRGVGRLTTAAYRTEFSDIDQVLAQARAGEVLRSDVRTVDYLFRKLANSP